MACSCLCLSRLFICCANDKSRDQESTNDSQSRADAADGTSSANDSTPHQRRLERAYTRVLGRDDEEEWKKKLFPQLRILVIGKTGAGKTTLIRHMVGKDGPDTITEHVPGKQDINKEFVYSSEEGGVPYLIHDSNGLDFNGDHKPVQEIKEFLENHQGGDDSSNHVHIVWYVIQVTDNRSLSDGGLMELIGKFKVPLLLILTFNESNIPVVTDVSLGKLLKEYGNGLDEREALKVMTVKLKNGGITIGANGEVTRDEAKRDEEGLKLVSKKTEELIDKRLKFTWIAAQAVDVDAKLELSAGLIAGYARKALLTSLSGVIPFADPIKLGTLFYRVFVAICNIWVVPKNLKEALNEILLKREGGAHVLRSVGQEILNAAGLAAIIATGVTSSCSGSTSAVQIVLQALQVAGIFAVSKSVPVLVRVFSMQVMATILYVKSIQVGSSTCRWKPDVSKAEYTKLCAEFVQDEEYRGLLEKFARSDRAENYNDLTKKTVKATIKNRLVEIHDLQILLRPTSLQSLFNKDDSSSSQHGETSAGKANEEDNEVDELEILQH